jgi:hypothetical protein
MEDVIAKKTEKNMVRPLTLDEGKEYFLRIHRDNGHVPVSAPVRFVSYHPCPALIVVGDGNGQFWRVARDDIFLAE